MAWKASPTMMASTVLREFTCARGRDKAPRGQRRIVAVLRGRAAWRQGCRPCYRVPIRHREFTRRCFMELRASESVSIESSTGFELDSRKRSSSGMTLLRRNTNAARAPESAPSTMPARSLDFDISTDCGSAGRGRAALVRRLPQGCLLAWEGRGMVTGREVHGGEVAVETFVVLAAAQLSRIAVA